MKKSMTGFWKVYAVILTTSFLILGASLLNVRPLEAQSQTFNASIGGSVLDNTGAVMPGVDITLTNVDQGFSRKYTTSDDGKYFFSLLPPGSYSLKAEKNGFRPFTQSGITLGLGQAASMDVTLQIGSVAQAITVTAAAPMLNVVDQNISADVTQHQVVELPLNLRNVVGFVFLSSSVNNSAENQVLNPSGTNSGYDDQDIAFFNFGGGRFGTTGFLLDGHFDVAGNWGGTIYVPGVDETQELKVQTNTFSAEYGLSMGNVVNLITKSGTDSFHGDAFEFIRNSDLDANNYFNNAAGIPRQSFRENQFGFTAGGPLYIPGLYKQRNKTFIFGSYQGRRALPPATLTTTLPTAAALTGNFSAFLGAADGTDSLGRTVYAGQIYNPFSTRLLTAGETDPITGLDANQTGYVRDPFSGNIVPSNMFDPVAKKLIPYWPSPTSSALVNNFTASGTTPATEDAYTVRVDQNISDKSRMFARWSQKREFLTLAAAYFGANDPAGPLNGVPDNRWDSAFGYNRVISPTFIVSFNFGWNRWVEQRAPQGANFNPSTVGLPSFLDGYANNFPAVAPQGIYGLGAAANGGGSKNKYPRNDRSYSLEFTKVKGGHNIAFGFDVVTFQELSETGSQASFNFPNSMTQGPNPISPDSTSGYGFASFLLGTGSSGGVTLTASSAEQKNYYVGYLQDNWKVTPKLSLNLGVRYEYQASLTDRFNRLSHFDFTAPNPLSAAVGFNVPGELVFTTPSQRSLFGVPDNTFAPRVGLTYRITSKLVLRSGYGIFYIPAYQLSAPLDGFTQTTPYVGTVDGITPFNLLSNPFPSGLTLSPGRSLGGLTNVGLSPDAIEPYRPTPYVNQWTLGFQYQFSNNNSLEVDYVGNHGVKLPFPGTNPNQLPDQDLSMGSALIAPVTNPFYGYITSSSCGLNQPTVPAGQLLLPHPQYCSVGDSQPPMGVSNYNALQVTYTHRWSKDLQVLASYTYSKYLDDTTGPDGWAAPGGGGIRDNYNLRNEYSLEENDIPHSLVVNYIYQLPVGHGKHFGTDWKTPANSVLGGWQLSGVTTAKSGFPLSIGTATNTSGSFGGGQSPNLIGNPHVSNPTVNEWFNTAAFAQAAPYTFGDVPRTMPNLRAPGFYNWDLGIMKWWRQGERGAVEFRAEMFNAFNHPQFYAPAQTFGVGNFGQISGVFPARDVQFGLKIYW